MSAHLSSTVLNGLVDGELSAEELAIAHQHLDSCSHCTSSALAQVLLKTAVAKSGRRYGPPPDLQERLKQLAFGQSRKTDTPLIPGEYQAGLKPARRIALAGWALAAMLLLAGVIVIQRGLPGSGNASAEHAALVAEVCDLHVAALAASAPAQVISTDRHTVKPWFQGKIPFSFNLPEQLPGDTKLEGANLVYLQTRPVAQLIFSIGKHRVSVFVQPTGANELRAFPAEHAGFHVNGFSTDDLEVVAVSDVEPARLSGLVTIIAEAQVNAHK